MPADMLRSITWDKGTEMDQAHHDRQSLRVSVFLSDPRSPWQRGSNENTNGPLRDYFPKAPT